MRRVDPTLVDVLEAHAQARPDAIAFRFLKNGEEEAERTTFAELWRDAQSIAAHLQRRHLPGSRALVLVESGIDFVRAFMGCLTAGVAPIPVKVPRKLQTASHLARISRAADTRFGISSKASAPASRARLDEMCEMAGIEQCALEDAMSEAADDAGVVRSTRSDLAFIQYTSGSTGQPKGVMVSHGNVIHNQAQIEAAFGHDERTVFVSWLPVFHDMGLVGCVLQPIYLGIEGVLMAPEAFVQRPARWLQAIGRYGGTTSGAPNFAYDHCTERVSDQDLAGLDLSSWKVAFNGSEPVRAETLRRFAERFRSAGFEIERFLPCYGMAEATLFVCGKHHAPTADLWTQTSPEPVSAAATPAGRPLVAVGEVDVAVRIVDPDDGCETSPGEIGEIWVAGPQISAGYFRDPDRTAGSFEARLTDDTRAYYRTGDLGRQRDGLLFVTGRLGDLMIVRGRNVYAQDVEDSASSCSHPLVFGRRGVAFSIVTDDRAEEQIVLVQELRKRPRSFDELKDVTALVRGAVAAEVDVQIAALVLVPAGCVPLTSSGKRRRSFARESYLSGRFAADGVSRWGFSGEVR